MSKPQPKKSRTDRAQDVALYRYSLIRPLADPNLSATERGRLVRELAAQVHLGPCGQSVTVSRASLDRWIRAWRADGFDALIPPERQVTPRTDAEVLELAARLKREHRAHRRPHRPHHRRRAGLGAVCADPATPLRPPGTGHPTRRQPAERVRAIRGRRTRRDVDQRRPARPDRRRRAGGAVRPAR